jgi:hypothetical protein
MTNRGIIVHMKLPSGQTWRLVTTAALGAALVAGVATVPASAAAANQTVLPKLGARSAPFSAKTSTGADISATPWVVGVEVADQSGAVPTFCTGTVLSPTKVLTAAGCDVPPGLLGRTEVIAGRDDLADDSVGFVDGVASTWTDQNFKVEVTAGGSNGSSVQVLTLTQPLPSVYTSIGLSAQGDESPYASGVTGTTYGYGLNDPAKNGPTVLSQATVTAQPYSACEAEAPGGPGNEESCAGFDTSALSTNGDQDRGDPLVVGGKVAGIGNILLNNNEQHLVFEKMSLFSDLVTADLSRQAQNNADWSGDGVADLFGVGSNGVIDYQGMGADLANNPGIAAQYGVDPHTWDGATLLRANNWNYDGKQALLEVAGNGSLFAYPEGGNGQVAYPGQFAGSGFSQFSKLVATNNFTGDGRPDLIGVKGDGTLWLYERTANGWVNGNGVQIGSGFNQFSSLMAFQWTDNGHIGLLGVNNSGALLYFTTDGAGHWVDGTGEWLGAGFGGNRQVLSEGSWAGTDTGSIMTVDQAGTLKVYTADGKGAWLNASGTQIGVGFNSLRELF